ncbi:hypothetical protein [Dongia deserti]|uniref:hypothetical protein n=1 Tax=Dongia deserti TaxID=2268030 RepID=UPI000E6460A0|nr:hypothetical protein [Dongia deserti]
MAFEIRVVREDRVSFGCSAEFELTNFDECLIGAWPKPRTGARLFDRTNTCVRLKESELSEASSLPQAFFADGRGIWSCLSGASVVRHFCS